MELAKLAKHSLLEDPDATHPREDLEEGSQAREG
jgi:hypothetical protein